MAYNYSQPRSAPSIRDLATAILVPQYNIDLNNPPAVPGVAVPQELDPFYPFICATIADELTKSAEITPAHTFLYNITANNNFDNVEFDNIVKAVVESIDAVMRNDSQGLDVPEVIANVSRDTVDGIAALTAKGNRELSGYLQNSDWNVLDAAAQVYSSLKQMQQSSSRAYSGNARQSYSGGRTGTRPGRPSPMAARQGNMQREERPGRQSQPLSFNEAARRRSPVTAGRAQPRPETTETPVVPQAPVSGETLHWRSTAKQPYRPAYNITAKEETLMVTPDGVISKPILRETIMEDYNAHTTFMGARATYPNQAERNRQVEVVLREAEAAAITESIGLTVDNIPAFDGSASMFTACLLAKHGDARRAGKQPVGATSHGGVVYIPSLGNEDETTADTFGWLANSRSYEQLGQRVRLLLSGNGDKYKLSAEQVRSLDSNMTKSFNRIMHRQLSIRPGDMFIQSFALDIDEVIAIFNKTDIYKAGLPGLRIAEKEFIAKHTFILEGAYKECAIRKIEELLLPAPAYTTEAKESMVVLGMPVMSVLLALCANEMSIDIDVGQTRALIATEHRQLATLVSTLVDMVNPVTDTSSNISLITLDCYEFELDKGLLGDHYYLITRIR